MKYLSLLFISVGITFFSCAQKTNSVPKKSTTLEASLKNYSTAVFASGCFWATEGKFESAIGVKEAVAGYSGGHLKSPTYEAVCSETTGHAEAIKVYYDPKIISYESLLKVFFSGIDPTQVNGQGPDIGSSYRSVIFYANESEKQAAIKYMAEIKSKYKTKLAVELLPLKQFWKAEDYHQDYIYENASQGYIERVSIPKIRKFQKEFPFLVKKGYEW